MNLYIYLKTKNDFNDCQFVQTLSPYPFNFMLETRLKLNLMRSGPFELLQIRDVVW
jgi:hypothetical protein